MSGCSPTIKASSIRQTVAIQSVPLADAKGSMQRPTAVEGFQKPHLWSVQPYAMPAKRARSGEG